MSRSDKSLVKATPAPSTPVVNWIQAMRNAAQGALKQEDVEAIVANQVAKAKQGDQAAIKFVFDQLLGGPMKGATFVQNVYNPPADEPAAEEPPPPRVPPTYKRPRDHFK
jgi:hypothetical protein